MTRGFEAINSVTIDAPKAEVWDALTNPAKVKQYLHGTEMSTDWREGPSFGGANGRESHMRTRERSSRSRLRD
jgi:uncharacterized protein YndB with AHSA1/START domain